MISNNLVRPFSVVSTLKAVSVAFLSLISSARSQASAFTNLLTNSSMRASSSTQALPNIAARSLEAQGASQTIAGLSNGDFVVLNKSGTASLLNSKGSTPLNLTDGSGKTIIGAKVFTNTNSKHPNAAFAVQTANSEIHVFEIQNGVVKRLVSQLPQNCLNPQDTIQNAGFLLNENVSCISGINQADDTIAFNCIDIEQQNVTGDVSESKVISTTVNVFYMQGETPKMVYTNSDQEDANVGEFEIPNALSTTLYAPTPETETCFVEWDYLEQYKISNSMPFAGRIAENQDRVMGAVGEDSARVIRFDTEFNNVTQPLSLNTTNHAFAATAKAVYVYSRNEKVIYQVAEDNIARKMSIDLGEASELAVSESGTQSFISNGVKVFEFLGIAQTDVPTPAPSSNTPTPTLAPSNATCTNEPFQVEIPANSTRLEPLQLISGSSVKELESECTCADAELNSQIIAEINCFGADARISEILHGVEGFKIENNQLVPAPAGLKAECEYDAVEGKNWLRVKHNLNEDLPEGQYEFTFPVIDKNNNNIGDITLRMFLSGKRKQPPPPPPFPPLWLKVVLGVGIPLLTIGMLYCCRTRIRRALALCLPATAAATTDSANSNSGNVELATQTTDVESNNTNQFKDKTWEQLIERKDSNNERIRALAQIPMRGGQDRPLPLAPLSANPTIDQMCEYIVLQDQHIAQLVK